MKRSVVTFIFSLFFIAGVQAQQPIDSTIAAYASKYAQERCYIHYDKASYSAGETIWFKAYLMEGISPATESKTFYIDWTDDKGNLLSRTLHPIVEASTNGQFDIPADYTGSYIHVKAYTKWMLNFDSTFIYNKDLRIISKQPAKAAAATAVTPSLQFFPEGGDAVAGISNKIAFKANDQWGRPVKIKGVIVNAKGEKLDSLKVKHDGMGFFYLTPQSGETYKAKWKDEKGTERTTDLPAIKPSGISLQVTVSGNKRTVTIMAPAASAASIGTVNLVGTINQFQAFKVLKDLSSGSAKAIIPVQDLPSGILTITVFDQQWKPLAERITYIDNGEYTFKPEMEVQRWGLSKRARNEIKLKVPDNIITNLSISITDIDIDTDSSNTIISHLMLTGDIRGKVNNPSYYFSSESDTVMQNLDLVMLTHGWRRFKWDDVAKGKLPAISYPKDTSYITLGGKIYGVMPSQLREGGNIIVIAKPKKGEGQVVVMPIQPSGKFEDPSLYVFDSVRVYYQLDKKKGLNGASVLFNETILPPFKYQVPATGLFYNQSGDTSGQYRHFLFADESARLIAQFEGKVLGNVVVKATTKSPVQVMDDKYTSGLFKGDALQFDLVNDRLSGAYTNIFNYLQGKVAGLMINTSGSNTSLQWRGGSPSLYVDEVSTDVDMISSIPVTDVAYIKVFRPPFMGGFNGANGAIAIYTRRGDDVKPSSEGGMSSGVVRGYNEIKQFYSPNYATFLKENEKRDIRTTLYWNPQVRTSPGKQEVVLSFYNNDISKAFRVIIEGMSQDGRLAHIEQLME